MTWALADKCHPKESLFWAYRRDEKCFALKAAEIAVEVDCNSEAVLAVCIIPPLRPRRPVASTALTTMTATKATTQPPEDDRNWGWFEITMIAGFVVVIAFTAMGNVLKCKKSA